MVVIKNGRAQKTCKFSKRIVCHMIKFEPMGDLYMSCVAMAHFIKCSCVHSDGCITLYLCM